MDPNDELCLCFHVTQRKVVNFIRIEKPKRVGQLSECFGANEVDDFPLGDVETQA